MILKKGNCVTCTKKRFSLISELSDKELATLDKGRLFISYKKGETILKTGMQVPGLICLSNGKAKIFRELPEDKELIIHLAKPVEFIGFRELLSALPASTTVEALEDSEVCIVDRDHFFSVLTNNNTFALKVIRFLASDILEQDNRMVILTQKYMHERLADTLLMLHEAYGDKEGFISLILSREEIASIANMSRSNAIRTLYEFEKDKLVEIKGKKIRILNSDKLAALSRTSTEQLSG